MEIPAAVIAVDDKLVVLLLYRPGRIGHRPSGGQLIVNHILPGVAGIHGGMQQFRIAAVAEIIGNLGDVEDGSRPSRGIIHLHGTSGIFQDFMHGIQLLLGVVIGIK